MLSVQTCQHCSRPHSTEPHCIQTGGCCAAKLLQYACRHAIWLDGRGWKEAYCIVGQAEHAGKTCKILYFKRHILYIQCSDIYYVWHCCSFRVIWNSSLMLLWLLKKRLQTMWRLWLMGCMELMQKASWFPQNINIWIVNNLSSSLTRENTNWILNAHFLLLHLFFWQMCNRFSVTQMKEALPIAWAWFEQFYTLEM